MTPSNTPAGRRLFADPPSEKSISSDIQGHADSNPLETNDLPPLNESNLKRTTHSPAGRRLFPDPPDRD